ncbi:MAG: alpha/beta hydrolase, partial [Chloroflexi bacterium]|nr:alpha/beta hydrolase [Chloroflexota bacterium]
AAAFAETPPSLEERRMGANMMGARFQNLDGISTEAVDADGVPAEWVAAPGANNGAVLYLHGGGYVTGSVISHRGMAANLSRTSGCRVLTIDYRLAPENKHPAQVQDAHTAYRWMLSNGAEPSTTIVAGDSAGGGLTVATLLSVRDGGDPLPAAGVCISPWVDMEGTGDSMKSKAGVDPMVSRDGLIDMAQSFLGDGDRRDPLAAPLHADLTGLPPLLIIVGTAEVLLDDAKRLHENAESVGVDSTLEIWDDMVHIWPWFAPFLPEGQQAMEQMGDFIKERIGSAVAQA